VDAAAASGTPVVQSLHDFSHFCIQSHFFRQGELCFDCVERGFLQGVRNKCFNDSLGGSLLTTFSRWLAFKKNILSKISGFTTPSEEIKALLVKQGLPKDRILVIDNPFIVADFPFKFSRLNSETADFIAAWGTFAEMKGFGTLLDALERMSSKVILKLFTKDVHAASSELKEKVARLQMQGRLEIVTDLRYGEELFKELSRARILVVPSEWLVTQEYTVWEGMLLGRPVIVGDRGGNQLLVENRELIFKAGDSIDLAKTLDLLWICSDEYLNNLGSQLQNRAKLKSDPCIYASKIENFYNEIK
jgi:glycosyltransferase involved in cell wall biosynthesis